uniref:Peptidase S1 domain-containing protein n=1 Tax=Oryzias sinensis TaxID=183150 RepID=A0A8C7X0M2_9TELE
TMKALGQFLLFHALFCAASHVQGSVIINGDLAPEGSMQFMVSVQNKNGHVCGGFLICEDFVVTAAHCDSGLKHVILGGHNWKYSNVKKIQISNQCKHKKYSDVQYGYDIMLLKVSIRLENIKTIPLAENDMNLSVNQECSVAGWGKMESTGGLVDDLRVVNVSIIDHNDCQQSWGGLPTNVICAGGKYTDKGFCQGDSGGPLVCNGKAVGIVSFNKHKDCKYPDVPNVYTDIREYVQWINNITTNKVCPM